MKRQVGSPMKWGLRWVSYDDDFFPDCTFVVEGGDSAKYNATGNT